MFKQLSRLWAHVNINVKRKVAIYQACVVSKVMYSLESLWLLKADQSRLDAFHCQCLRKILRIPHSYVSHVTNEAVLEQACQARLSSMLGRRQVKLYRKIQELPADSFLKKLVCQEGGQPIVWSRNRRRGRPRQVWARSVYGLCSESQ